MAESKSWERGTRRRGMSGLEMQKGKCGLVEKKRGGNTETLPHC